MLNSSKLIIFAAPSGAGKSSLIKKIIEISEEKLELSVSATTRLPRKGEIHGKDYFFISDNEFNELKDKDAFIECANVHGNQYGTLKSFVHEKLEEGISVILDIDVQGFAQIRETIEEMISIFIIPPSLDELEKRLTSRGLDTNDAIEKRLLNAVEELKHAESFDYIVLNDNFDNAIDQLSSVIFANNKYNNEINLNILRDLLD
jgi:guanylate kinase|tara:strand:+ start:603 stop:1214 length:612 start_codon:yes stop_codon:yes gene_type:complete